LSPEITIDTEILLKENAIVYYDEDSHRIVLGRPTTRLLRRGEPPLTWIIHHEYMHHVLNILEGRETSLLYDNLDYLGLEGSPSP